MYLTISFWNPLVPGPLVHEALQVVRVLLHDGQHVVEDVGLEALAEGAEQVTDGLGKEASFDEGKNEK